MADYHTTYKGPEGQTTEWDELQRKLGNLPEKEPEWKPEAYTPEEDQPTKDTTFLDSKDVEELEQLEDDFTDDRFLEEYRRRRIEELKTGPQRPKFGSLIPIRGNDFVKEVTNAGDAIWVICHLYQDHITDCSILNACFTELAERYPNTKFVKIKSTDCIPGYPDENLPTVLIYKDTKCLHNLVGLHQYGGRGTSPDKIALALSVYGEGICGDVEEQMKQFKGLLGELIDKRVDGGGLRGGNRKGEEDGDEDSDFDE